MKLEEMAAWLKRYERAVRETDIFRYTNTVSSVEGWPDIFGMNFEKVMSAPPEQAAAVFLAQEERADLLRRLMAGQAVDDRAMLARFGFTSAQLAEHRRGLDPVKKELPRNLCVLCFDDALKSHYTDALPLLEKYGFQATFFIAEMKASPRGPGFEDKSRFMTWEEIKAIQDAGFELGNHSFNHVFGSQNMGRDFNLAQIRGMEEEFAAHGLDKPVTYAYPSGICNPEVLQCARDCGYRWGRGNLENGPDGIRGMTYYDPRQDSPLAICNFGDPDFYTEETLRARIGNTPGGTVFGLTYHDVSEAMWPGSCTFARQMELLAGMGMKVISIRELEEYVDPEKAYQYTL